MPKTSQKDVIYIDVDDEITTIIDKVTSSDQKIAALVLPKRLPAMQSIVNMKLLKQSAKQANKSIVLITSSDQVLPFAGAVGLYVAKTLQSKPAIPAGPKMPKKLEVSDAGNIASATETTEAAEVVAPKKAEALATDQDTIAVDNSDKPTAKKSTENKDPKSRKPFKIPNFNAFRIKVIVGIVLLLLLIVGGIFAFVILPKAEIVVRTNTDTIDTKIELLANTALEKVDKEANAIPAVLVSSEKTDAETVNATGEKNVGKQATGVVVLQNCRKSDDSITIPAGTGVSSGTLTYITSADVTLPSSKFSGGSNSCITSAEEVAVVAQNPGTNYNLDAGSSFTVAGYSNIAGENEENMSGGTDETVKVIQQSDIDGAKQAVMDRFNEDVKNNLIEQNTTDDTIALKETYTTSEPIIATNFNVDDEAERVTVTVKSTVAILTISLVDVREFVEDAVKEQIDPGQQTILDDGLNEASTTVPTITDASQVSIVVATQVTAGPELSEQTVKEEVIGKKKGEAIRVLEDRPGIDLVDINYSPFWVYSTPSDQQKITVRFEQSNE